VNNLVSMRKKLLWIQCGAAAMTVAATLASSGPPALPASFRAAYRAFCDPHLVDPAPPATPAAATACAPKAQENHLEAKPIEETRPPLEAEIARTLDLGGSDPAGPDPDDADLAKLSRPDLEIPITRRTMRYVRFYTRTAAGRHVFLSRYRRAARYRDFIEDTLHDAGLPGDLVWLPAIESGYDAHAVSPVGATGLWQFMPETGAAYGLVQSPLIDERISVPQATRAAVKHLHDLHERFGRWDLALAAYNAGSGRVQSAMTRLADQEPRPQIAFAGLASARLLPEETASYVPQVMAFALVAANVSELGLDVDDLPASMDIGELSVPEGTHLDTVARAAGISLDQVRDYNPQLLADHVPEAGGSYLVALPADRVERARAAFPACFDQEVIGKQDDDEPADPEGEAPPAEAQPVARSAGVEQRAPQKEVARIKPPDAEVARPRPAPPAAPIPPVERPAPPLNTVPRAVEAFKVFTLKSGVLVRVRREPETKMIRLTVRIGSLDDPGTAADPGDAPIAPSIARGPRHGDGGASEAAQTIAVSRSYLAAGIELASTRLKLMVDEIGSASLADIRRRAGATRLRALEKAPYGSAWIALGNALFPAGHPLAGTVLGASQDLESRRMLLVADLLQSERAFAKASLTVVGDVDENVVEKLAEASLRSLALPADLPIAPPAHQIRVAVEEAVRPPRMLLGWLAPAEGEADDAPLRVLLEILENPRIARLHQALIEREAAASTARASLELGLRAGVVTFDLGPAPGREIASLERLFDGELAHLADEGPSESDVTLAKSLLRAKIEEEIAAEESASPASGATGSSLRHALQPTSTDALLTRIDEVTVDSVKSMISRVFSIDHRAVVVAAPSAREAGGRLARQ
jgi:soluble lytic murein transglycosylase-like protein